jgi:hypothetical protein
LLKRVLSCENKYLKPMNKAKVRAAIWPLWKTINSEKTFKRLNFESSDKYVLDYFIKHQLCAKWMWNYDIFLKPILRIRWNLFRVGVNKIFLNSPKSKLQWIQI